MLVKDMRLLDQKQRQYIIYSNRSSLSIVFALVPWVPTEWHKGIQMTPAFPVGCDTGRDSELREPKYFYMGNKHACVLLSRGTLYLPRLFAKHTSLKTLSRINSSHCLTHKTCKNTRNPWRCGSQEYMFPFDRILSSFCFSVILKCMSVF